MLKSLSLLLLALVGLSLGGCTVFGSYEHNQPLQPTSHRPWGRSMATDLPFQPANGLALFELPAYDGYPDNRMLAIRRVNDTALYWHHERELLDLAAFGIAAAPGAPGRPDYRAHPLPDDLNKLYFKGITHKDYVTPGTVFLYDISLYIDEVELANIEWQHFLNYVARDSGQAVAARYSPEAAQLPRPTYFTDPFYRYYPVVGVSRAQVDAYCRWRSAITTETLAGARGLEPTDPDYMAMRYRLPTEAEWEYAAGSSALPQEPYGVLRPENQLQVDLHAAAYLRTRAQLSQSVTQLTQDIKAFNKAAPAIIQFNCQREAPYFLALPTPGYVFDLPNNIFGLYHMAGNVAELVQEPGVTKGGSYRDPLAACAIKARGSYAGPAPSIGFRCVCEISFPNRRL